jgi:hypothetical protein
LQVVLGLWRQGGTKFFGQKLGEAADMAQGCTQEKPNQPGKFAIRSEEAGMLPEAIQKLPAQCRIVQVSLETNRLMHYHRTLGLASSEV